MLKKVEMTVTLHHGVIDVVFSGHLGMSKPASRDKVHGHRQRPSLSIEGYVSCRPGCINPHSHLEERRFRYEHHYSSGSLADFYP